MNNIFFAVEYNKAGERISRLDKIEYTVSETAEVFNADEQRRLEAGETVQRNTRYGRIDWVSGIALARKQLLGG